MGGKKQIQIQNTLVDSTEWRDLEIIINRKNGFVGHSNIIPGQNVFFKLFCIDIRNKGYNLVKKKYLPIMLPTFLGWDREKAKKTFTSLASTTGQK